VPASPIKTERSPYGRFVILQEFLSGTLISTRIEGRPGTFPNKQAAQKWIDQQRHLREKAELPRPVISNDEDESPRCGISI